VALAPNDSEIAAGLAGDGLAVLREGRLCAPTAAELS
jgi:hypothetical protein